MSARSAGTSLVELLVAIAVFSIVAAATSIFLTAVHAGYRREPPLADAHQRLRAAADMLHRDIIRAGSGLVLERDDHPWTTVLPGVVPRRLGFRQAEDAGVVRTDCITLLRAAPARPQARLAAHVRPSDGGISTRPIARCHGSPCGFSGTLTVIASDRHVGAALDVVRVAQVAGPVLAIVTPGGALSRQYLVDDTGIAAIEQQTYRFDRERRRLVRYDGYLSEAPVIDGVEDLRFTYVLDPDPRAIAPPQPGASHCAYTDDEPPRTRLHDYGGQSPVEVESAALRDGPFCGSGALAFDADLLRVRMVRVRLTVRNADPRPGGARVLQVAFDAAVRHVR